MPIFITGGGPLAVHQMSYGNTSQATVDFLQNQLQAIQATPYLASYAEVAKAQFEALNGDEARRLADGIMRSADSMYGDNVVRSLTSITELQTASLEMQRWLMTSELLRQMASANQINGWRETYVDRDPGLSGIYQADYRILHQGVARNVRDGDWMIKQFYEEQGDGEARLTLLQKQFIAQSISFAEYYTRKHEDDISSPYGDFM